LRQEKVARMGHPAVFGAIDAASQAAQDDRVLLKSSGGAERVTLCRADGRLIEELKKLRAWAPRCSALRVSYSALDRRRCGALAEAVRGLKASLRLCSICNNVTDVDPAPIAPTRRAISGWFAWSRSRRASPRLNGAGLSGSLSCVTWNSLATAWRGTRTVAQPARWLHVSNAAR